MDERPGQRLNLPPEVRAGVWGALIEGIESYLDQVPELHAAGQATDDTVRRALDAFDFEHPVEPEVAVQQAVDALRELQPHVGHPRYFGLFESPPTTMGIVGDALAAAFNACLATRDGSPFGVAAEQRLITEFGARLGYDGADGIITTGGSEANHSALLLALTDALPEFAAGGLLGVERRPVVYCSAEAHPSIPKAARLVGLGADSIRAIPTDAAYRIDLGALHAAITADREAGRHPLMLALTAGTTGAGAIDPLTEGAEIAARYGMWLHVDAAWGGAAALLPEERNAFVGLDRADSITFDPHKWMSVPLSAGLLLTKRTGVLRAAFDVRAGFLDTTDVGDPYTRSMRWSRGFTGLKVLLSLAVAGWDGYRESLTRQIRLGRELRQALERDGWRIVNDTPLPVVCFDAGAGSDDRRDVLPRVAQAVNATGRARLFLIRLGEREALRACVTNPATSAADIHALVTLLRAARAEATSGSADPRPELAEVPIEAGRCQATRLAAPGTTPGC